MTVSSVTRRVRTIPHLRWWIGGLLFSSTVINYIDRQTLAVLAPRLKFEFHWTNTDWALVLIGFRLAYAIGQAGAGKFLDRVGTRAGLSLTVGWYSAIALLTSTVRGLGTLTAFRFCSGLGEAANWPGATKAVSEWFPRRERGFAVALFDSGSAIGAAVALVVVPILLHIFKSWRIVFLVTGTLSMSWVFLWRKVYHSPETHPRISEEERDMILSDRDQERLPMPGLRWRDLLRLRQTWGVVIGRSLTDPLWYFIADWFAIFLGTKGISIEQGAPFFWVPFLAADAGNFLGGGVSSWLVRRGWPVVRARKAVIVVCGLGMCSLMGCVFTSSILMLAALFAISTCCYAAWSTMALTLPSDLFPQEHVASVSGLSGAGSGLATVFSTLLIGRVADRLSFTPVLAVGSVIGLLATVAVLVLVRGVPKNPRSVEA